MFKNRGDYLEIIDSIEDEILDKLPEIFGFSPWFIIKIQLSYQLHLAYAKNQIPDLRNYKKKYIKRTFKSDLPNLIFKLVKALWEKRRLEKFFDFENTDILLVGNTAHIEQRNSGQYNRYLNPFEDIYSERKIQTIYSDRPYSNLLRNSLKVLESWYCNYYRVLMTFNSNEYDKLIGYGRVINQFLSEKHEIQIEGLEYFLADRILEYQIFRKIYGQLLKKLKPNTLIAYCYYDNKINAMYGAAKQQGIETMEYQHSSISGRHFAYTRWKNIDSIAQHIPNKFLVWEEKDKRVIEDNFSGISFVPEVEVVGVLSSYGEVAMNPVKQEKNILICLQGLWMPKWLEGFIENDTLYNWFIRLHPRYPNDREKLKHLESVAVSKIKSEEANSLSLDELILRSEIMLTNFSGSALEAKVQGRPVLIFGDEGRKTYQSEIENGVFFFVSNKDAFESLLTNLINKT